MRISTLLLDDSLFSEITLFQHNNGHNLVLHLAIFIVIVFGFYNSTFAQWVNNPKANTKLVIDTNDPVNISSVRDFNGGAFIFWQDKKEDLTNQVYFIHFDADGVVSLRSDGKDISTSTGMKELPVCSENIHNTAVVVWKDFSLHKTGDIFAQRLAVSGDYLWNSKGVQLTDSNKKVFDYSISSDKKGYIYVAYISGDPGMSINYAVEYIKMSPDGISIFDSACTVIKSQNRKSMSKIIPDNLGGCYIFWIEIVKNKSVLFLQHINPQGKIDWKKAPVSLSDINYNVIGYTANSINPSFAYAAWQILKKNKGIYHQLINNKGIQLWGNNGKSIASQNGNQINPQAVANDSSIILSWTHELNNNQNIYVQKYNLSGNPLWDKDGRIVIGLNRAQFGQKIISDGKRGAIISWYDRRKDSTLANIYSQRISLHGSLLWDSLGVEIFANDYSQKSYLSVVPDESGGAIAIIKENRKGKNEIYSQRIFDSGTFISQLLDFSSTLIGDSVKLSWICANDLPNATFDIQRSIKSDSGSSPWQIIGTLKNGGKMSSKYYEYFDKPDLTGTIYYRVTEVDSIGPGQTSEIRKINYFEKAVSYTLGQNNPNPFSDSTSISFFLPDTAEVKFQFFNNHLELIQDTSKTCPAGENNIIFHANKMEPGIYFYRMKVDDFIDVRKMVITK
jgi:hypothetical protein